MRTIAIAALFAAVSAQISFVGAALAQPSACIGRFVLDGEPLELGGGLDPTRMVTLTRQVSPTGGSGPLLVVLGDPAAFGGDVCRATVVTQAPRTDVFAVRAKFEQCGERPRFRVRLRFDAACQSAIGRVRQFGRVIASFTATGSRRTPVVPIDPSLPSDPFRPAPVDPTDPVAGAPRDPGAPTPIDPGAPADPTPVDPMTPADPPSTDGGVRPVGTTPTISTLEPLVAQPGETISLFGANLDRDTAGDLWVAPGATPPYVVLFPRQDPGLGPLTATPTFVSPERIDVRVPSLAVSGTLVLASRSFRRTPISETLDRLVVVAEEPPAATVPQTGTPPTTANAGTLTLQETSLSFFNAGSFAVNGPFQIGAFLDANGDHVVNLVPAGRDDVPYLAFPVRSSEFDFAIESGRGYFQGSNAILWVFFEGGNPAVLDANDQFFVVHLSVDLANRTARPIAMLAGVAGSPGIVMLADQFAAETSITVATPGGGVGALSGRIAAVPIFLENIFLPSQPGLCLDGQTFCADPGPSIEQRLWGNGVTIDFDVPLFADN